MPKPLLLLVDDAPEMAALVRVLAARAGCEVAACGDAGGAWAALQARRPDLVLLDVNLPGVSGPDLLRRLRAAPEFAGLAVAVYCHADLGTDAAAGLEAGADFVFFKDLAVRPDDWRRRLKEVLGGAHGRPPPPSLGWTAGPPRPAAEWVAAVNRALRDSALRKLGPEVTRAVLRRALAGAAAGWLTADGLALDVGRTPAPSPEAAGLLAARFTEQLWRLLGADAARAVTDAADRGR